MSVVYMIVCMRVRTSVTLPKDLIERMDELAGEHASRSQLIEVAVRAYLEQRSRAIRDQRDLEILNRCADRLNAEAEDALAYQVEE